MQITVRSLRGSTNFRPGAAQLSAESVTMNSSLPSRRLPHTSARLPAAAAGITRTPFGKPNVGATELVELG